MRGRALPSRWAQIRVQVSGNGTFAVRRRKETGSISLALNCFTGKMGVRASVCPSHSRSVNRDQTGSQIGKQSENFRAPYIETPPGCRMGLEEAPRWTCGIHLQLLFVAPAVLSPSYTFYAELCSHSIREVLSLLFFLSVNADIEARRDGVSFPWSHNKIVNEITQQ